MPLPVCSLNKFQNFGFVDVSLSSTEIFRILNIYNIPEQLTSASKRLVEMWIRNNCRFTLRFENNDPRVNVWKCCHCIWISVSKQTKFNPVACAKVEQCSEIPNRKNSLDRNQVISIAFLIRKSTSKILVTENSDFDINEDEAEKTSLSCYDNTDKYTNHTFRYCMPRK